MKVYIVAGLTANKEINIIKIFDDLTSAENFKIKYEDKIKKDPFSKFNPSIYYFVVERKLLI